MTAPNSAVTEPPGRRRWTARVLAVLAILGPGLIAANAGNDAGGILTYASAGAQFGYRTLFLMVLVTVALIVVAENHNGVWSVSAPVPAGVHRYAFLVNGKQWVADPTAPRAAGDDFGQPSSALVVEGSLQ